MRTLLAEFSGMSPFKATFSYNLEQRVAQSPDGISNWLLCNQPVYVAGVSSANSVDIGNPNTLGIGQSVVALASNFPDSKVYEWNAEIEKELTRSVVLRIKYDGKHGANLDQLNNINPQQSDYIWYTENLAPTPTGSYSSGAGGGRTIRMHTQTSRSLPRRG